MSSRRKKIGFVLFLILEYLLLLFPFTGLFGFHWIPTFRKLHSTGTKIHNLCRICLLSFFNFGFWFTRLFVCDYRWMSASGFIPWKDDPDYCTDGNPHPDGTCYGTAVFFFLVIHLFSGGLCILFWIIDFLSLLWFEIWFELKKRHKAVSEESLKSRIEIGNSKENTKFYKFLVFTTFFLGSFSFGLFITWLFNIFLNSLTQIEGWIQGIISLSLSFTFSFVVIGNYAVIKYWICRKNDDTDSSDPIEHTLIDSSQKENYEK